MASLLVASLLVAGAFAVSAAIPYWLIRDGDPTTRAEGPNTDDGTAQRTPIDPDDTSITPEPGATPDTSIPSWYIPYVNADSQKPHFRGELNGFQIDPEYRDTRTPLEVCPPDGFDSPPPRDVGDIDPRADIILIDLSKLPPGLHPQSGVWLWTCQNRVVLVNSVYSVDPGTAGANPGGGSISIYRSLGPEPIIHGAPSDRWLAIDVAGRPAVVSPAVVETADAQFGSCFVAVYDSGTGVLTQVIGSASTSALCIQVAEVLVR